ncbi:Uncharacterised protein [Mycolicibacterium phlei]|uniref:hypothetical protein n=1 Tax=Mycobacteroides chelonae TaxID=1774 RepID=UPI0006189B30|nr:hypothetical protein [Mycobacteroides chelonae]VEG15568.1 Uncharacterised protein [Mycolicibacterium phlei]AKC38316.1 hypothetical protein GR01_06625 [Mycobacteroides chelonae]ANA97558.1 hypothetical protein BB28_07080 [Mycobacteroides chelonae CCUG 47445]OLT75336.1 hypothetical protein BKG56_16510 [Mycobacteroides chelonae]ORV12996.1 hypothetical protein AWB96_16755 [Mycobacteroides chelonae]
MVGPVERNVNVVQEVVESVGSRVGRIIRIITRTVGEVGQELSGVVADGFEIAEANKRARADHERWGASADTDLDDAADDDAEEGELVDLDDEGHDDDTADAGADDENDAVVEEVTSESEVDEARDGVSEQERV